MIIKVLKENNNFETTTYESNKYMSIVEKQIQKFEDAPKDLIIKGLLSIIINADSRNKEIEEVKEVIERRQAKNSNGGVRMFITLGKRDDIKVYTITDMLVKSTNLTNANINNVAICDKFSFFEVPNEFVDEVLSLNGQIRYKGRKVNIEITKNPKTEGTKTSYNGKEELKKRTNRRSRK